MTREALTHVFAPTYLLVRDRTDGLVAASMGSYGAVLANGAEYTGVFDTDVEGLVRFHEERLGSWVESA